MEQHLDLLADTQALFPTTMHRFQERICSSSTQRGYSLEDSVFLPRVELQAGKSATVRGLGPVPTEVTKGWVRVEAGQLGLSTKVG